MDINDIKFIRALWGDFNEITDKPTLNEVVYVWGEDNYDSLIKRGFNCHLVSVNNRSIQYENYRHKLDALYLGVKEYGKVIFLDWDVSQVKPLDDNFYFYFKDKEILMPTYSYPIEYMGLINLFKGYQGDWVNTQINEMSKYGWRVSDSIVLPNAGFIYCSNLKICEELIGVYEKNSLKTLVEEFAMFSYTNCTLDEYIKKYEPNVIFGRDIDNNFYLGPINRKAEKPLHDIILQLIKKDVYFIHE